MYNVSATRLTLYAFISSIETDLRRFISSQTNELTQSLILDEILLNRLKERARKSNDFDDGISNLFVYLDFGDCISLVNKFKTFMPTKFSNELNELGRSLEKITPIRNRVMHSRPLEFEDFPTTAAFLENLHSYSIVDWTNTSHIKEQIKTDPAIIFGIKIPDMIDSSEERILHNLPPAEFDDTGFIGRNTEVDTIKKKIFSNYPVISIIGDGGIGKTALMLKCLYDIIDDPKQPFDAIIWISLKTKTLNNGEFKNITNSIASTLDIYKEIESVLISGQQSNKPEEMINGILEYMSEFNILLVLDNLESINSESIREFLFNIPVGSKVAITSRIGIGEFEARHILEGFNKRERVFFLKRLAQNCQLLDILRTNDSQLDDICKLLHSNPLAIKWFVANLVKGEPIESILAHTENLTSYCMSNVYDKLSNNAKRVLETMLIYGKECTDAELAFILELESILHRKALNELLTTNMVRMRTISENSERKSMFSITDFAKEYLNQHCKPSNQVFILVNKRIKSLKGLGENLSLEIDINPYDPKSLTYSHDNPDELIAAYNLKQALVCSAKNDFTSAIQYLNKAKDIAPNYFEVYKIAGFINAANRDYFTADQEYETAIQCKEDSAPLLYLYAGFRMRFLEDFDGALNLTEKADELDPLNPHVKLQKARIYSIMNQFEAANDLFTILMEKCKDSTSTKIRRITIDQTANNLRKWADKCIAEEDYIKAIVLLKEALAILENLDKSEKDWKIFDTISKILISLINVYKLDHQENKEGFKTILEVLKGYGVNMRFSDKYTIVKRGLNSLLPMLQESNRKEIETFIFDDIKGLARQIEEEYEGLVIEKYESFGFLANGSFQRMFFFWKDLLTDFSKLNIGDRVKFVLGENKRGPCAKNLDVVQKYGETIV